MLPFLLVVGLTFACILARPFRLPAYISAFAGCLVCLLCGWLPVHDMLVAFRACLDVIAFLIGMMLLSELSSTIGLFDWVAALALSGSRGSKSALFAIVYGSGVIVTALFSNDATAVVLTPSVAAIAARARIDPIPFVLACAFVANAASTLLPIANPANLVLYAAHPPPFLHWLQMFWLPSVCAIVVTGLLLYATQLKALRGEMKLPEECVRLTPRCRAMLAALPVFAVLLLIASQRGIALGIVTLSLAIILTLGLLGAQPARIRDCLGGVSWGVLALVAGFYGLTAAATHVGAIAAFQANVPPLPTTGAVASFAAGFTALSMLVNNLPVGVLLSQLVNDPHRTFAGLDPEYARRLAVLVVDIGPNIALTASLATILWLEQLKKSGIVFSGIRFFRLGLGILPVTLFLAIIALR
jgi:arsenical pump membrane protein